VARVVVTPTATADLQRLIATHSLPADTAARVRRSAGSLAVFPLLGAALEGRWRDFRFILGPWRWLLVVYVYEKGADTVYITTFQDGRASTSPTSAR
jgi:hypothetical protein